MSDTQERPSTFRWIARGCVRWVERFLTLLGVLAVVYWCCFDCSYLVSDSMAPTLQWTRKSCDSVLTERVSYWFRPPRRWEVITFYIASGAQVMKRVVGLPGETVQMPTEKEILIDGQRLVLPREIEQLSYFPDGDLREGKTFACRDGYFVLGDHSQDSDDSRYNGAVLPESIVGRAWLILKPWSRSGFVR